LSMVFKRSGPNSRFPGTVYMYYSAPPFANNTWGASINKRGEVRVNQSTPGYICTWLDEILSSPIEKAKLNGIEYNICCFCGKELTNADSVAAGYGPICASNWGLPWEGMAAEAEKEKTINTDELENLK
jgi:hypothetical protein